MILLSALVGCERNEPAGNSRQVEDEVYHGMIELGEKLNDPYTVENIRAALANVDPTKADRVEISTTDLYVRFLPQSEEEFDKVRETGAYLLDHPVDYRIVADNSLNAAAEYLNAQLQYFIKSSVVRYYAGERYSDQGLGVRGQ